MSAKHEDKLSVESTPAPKDEGRSIDEKANSVEGSLEATEGGDEGSAPELLAELKTKAQERDLFLNELKRTKADFENLQKRVRRERPQLQEAGARAVLGDLLTVVDNFERAIDSLRGDEENTSSFEEGFRLIHQQLCHLLDQHGVREIAAEGQPFNPEYHEAVAQSEVTDRPTGEIIGVLQKGYLHCDVVLRPPKVQVALNVAGDADSKAESADTDAPDDRAEN